MYGWLGKSFNIQTAFLSPDLNFYSILNEPKINVINFTVKLDNVHETRQMNKTPTTNLSNLSMSAIKEIEAKTINPVIGTHHFTVSAYKDHRHKEMVRVIAIVLRSKIGNLFCHLCDHRIDSCNVTKAEVNLRVKQGSYPYFNYSFAAILCDSSKSRIATKVRIANSTRIEKTFLHIPIRNIIKPPLSYNFTVCLSQIFNKYNDALQFVQAMEMYKILGVQRVAVYNISCGPNIEKVLKYYENEGTLEVIPWNIYDYLTPSKGWHPKGQPGHLHYHGQLVSLNECLNRYMYHSKYILFHDFDEIVLPMKHNNLNEMMNYLERLHHQSTIGEVKIKRYFFMKKDNSYKTQTNSHLKTWRSSLNILEYIEGRLQSRGKVIVDPRQIVQIAVHETLRKHGNKIVSIDLKPEIAHMFHCKKHWDPANKKKMIKETRIRDFSATLIQNVNKVFQQCGFDK